MKDVGKYNSTYRFSLGQPLNTALSYELNLVIHEPEKQPGQLLIPISIFKSNLSSLQAIVVYFKENLHMRYCEIAGILNRDQRTIWVTYNQAKSLLKGPLPSTISELDIPASLFQDRNMSVLEHIVRQLRSRHLRLSQISRLLNLDQRTIWTVGNRVAKKLEKNET